MQTAAVVGDVFCIFHAPLAASVYVLDGGRSSNLLAPTNDQVVREIFWSEIISSSSRVTCAWPVGLFNVHGKRRGCR